MSKVEYRNDKLMAFLKDRGPVLRSDCQSCCYFHPIGKKQARTGEKILDDDILRQIEKDNCTEYLDKIPEDIFKGTKVCPAYISDEDYETHSL